MRFDGLLGEEKSHADLAIHETIRDQLENLDLARSRLLLQLLQWAGKRDDLSATATSFRYRVESAAMVDITGQDLLALGSVHGNGPIGLDPRPL